MIRRRKRNGMWLPPDLGNVVLIAGNQTITSPEENAVKQYVQTSTPQQGVTVATDIALVGDFNENSLPNAAGATLADFSVGYSLQRVVGKIFVGIQQGALQGAQDVPYNVMCTAGIMVRRVSDGGATVTYSAPQAYDSQTDPWLWRRTWMLCNQAEAVRQGFYIPWPSNNGGYGSVMDGPHVDAKTRRTVKHEERLYLTLQHTWTGPGESIAEGALALYWNWDLRFFGRVFQSAGNRRNASR